MKTAKFAKKSYSSTKRSRPKLIDLHLHSTYSDGEYDVPDLINACLNKELKAISITDHDTIDAYNEGKEYTEEVDMELIAGVELSSFHDGCEIHILGYLFDPTNLTLNMKLLELQQKRKTRAKRIVQKLNGLGVDIAMDRVFEKAKGTSIGRPHIATVIVEEEYVANFAEAFEKYLSTEFIKEFETEKPSPFDSINLITQAGGVAVLAHPAKTSRDDLIVPLVESGLGGIETYTHGIDKLTVAKYREIAKQYDLVCCGGSDFHNDRGGSKFGPGSVRVPYSPLKSLRKKAGGSS